MAGVDSTGGESAAGTADTSGTSDTSGADGPDRARHGYRLTRASAQEAAVLVGGAVLPVLLGGVILRRPWGTALGERVGLDRRGVETVRALHRRHGPGPVRVDVAGRTFVLVLEPADVRRVLEGTPEPFTPAGREKRGALGQFQPHGVLATRDPALRAERRRLNETALGTGHRLHASAGHIVPVVRDEAASLVDTSAVTGFLSWDDFAGSWWRTVRRIVFGDAARDDTAVTGRLQRLRGAASLWSFAPRRRALRRDFLHAVRDRARRAEPGTLAGAVREAAAAREPAGGAGRGADPYGQLPHWLFAFDAAGIATLRTLALLATHPRQVRRAREEALAGGHDGPRALPYLRACVRESVRLWPTTPLLLRESTRQTRWGDETLPAGTGFVLYTPYLHRVAADGTARDAFDPDAWPGDRPAVTDASLIPFSAGPGRCPGEDVVLLTATTWLATALASGASFQLISRNHPDPDRPLPTTLDHFALRFRVRR
jgi:cytochrome P450